MAPQPDKEQLFLEWQTAFNEAVRGIGRARSRAEADAWVRAANEKYRAWADAKFGPPSDSEPPTP